MTIFAGALILLGAGLELVALELGRRDLVDAAAAGAKRKEQMPKMMAAGKHEIDEWITHATRTRTRGIWFFGAGVIAQAIGGLVGLA